MGVSADNAVVDLDFDLELENLSLNTSADADNLDRAEGGIAITTTPDLESGAENDQSKEKEIYFHRLHFFLKTCRAEL